MSQFVIELLVHRYSEASYKNAYCGDYLSWVLFHAWYFCVDFLTLQYQQYFEVSTLPKIPEIDSIRPIPYLEKIILRELFHAQKIIDHSDYKILSQWFLDARVVLAQNWLAKPKTQELCIR